MLLVYLIKKYFKYNYHHNAIYTTKNKEKLFSIKTWLNERLIKQSYP